MAKSLIIGSTVRNKLTGETMTFKQGKFYDDNKKVVPLEHGNREQIAILETISALKDGTLFMVGYPFHCLCGAIHEWQFFEGKRLKCSECFQRYEFFLYDDDVPCVKLITGL